MYCLLIFVSLVVGKTRDVTEPAKVCIRRMRILCAKSVGCGCGFVMQSKLVSAIIATVIQLCYLELIVTNKLAVHT